MFINRRPGRKYVATMLEAGVAVVAEGPQERGAQVDF
jgi:hypothetical protein